MKIHRVLLASTLSLAAGQAIAQNNCTTLIQYGLKDEIQSLAQSNNYQQSINQLCRDYRTFQSDKKAGTVKATYGAFDGSAGFAAERYDAVSDALCTNNTNIGSLTSATQLTNKLLNPAALEALKQCEALNAYGLRVTTEIAQDDTRIVISFFLMPVPGTTGVITVDAPSIQSDVTCEGPTPALTGKDLPPHRNITYVCSRNVPSVPFEYLGQRLYAKSTMVTIPTSSGSVTRNLPAIYAPRLPPSDLERQLLALRTNAPPLGTVVASHLSFEELQKDNPEFAAYWQPADGRIVSRSSAYFKMKTDQSLNPVKLPDMRGVFIRGLNRFDASGELGSVLTAQADPESRVVGNFQADSFKLHTHPITEGKTNFAYLTSGTGLAADRGPEVRFMQLKLTAGEMGGAETRPKNIALYYYIRVN